MCSIGHGEQRLSADARPFGAIGPSYWICESTLASVRLPTESTAPAQRSFAAN
jgi:hypothetical protein